MGWWQGGRDSNNEALESGGRGEEEIRRVDLDVGGVVRGRWRRVNEKIKSCVAVLAVDLIRLGWLRKRKSGVKFARTFSHSPPTLIFRIRRGNSGKESCHTHQFDMNVCY